MSIAEKITNHVENNNNKLYYTIAGDTVAYVVSFIFFDTGESVIVAWRSRRKGSVCVTYPTNYISFENRKAMQDALSVECHRCMLGLDEGTIDKFPQMFISDSFIDVLSKNKLGFAFAKSITTAIHQY